MGNKSSGGGVFGGIGHGSGGPGGSGDPPPLNFDPAGTNVPDTPFEQNIDITPTFKPSWLSSDYDMNRFTSSIPSYQPMTTTIPMPYGFTSPVNYSYQHSGGMPRQQRENRIITTFNNLSGSDARTMTSGLSGGATTSSGRTQMEGSSMPGRGPRNDPFNAMGGSN